MMELWFAPKAKGLRKVVGFPTRCRVSRVDRGEKVGVISGEMLGKGPSGSRGRRTYAGAVLRIVTLRRRIFLTCIGLVALLAHSGCGGSTRPAPESHGPTSTAGTESQDSDVSFEKYQRELVSRGWEEAAAQAVTRLNLKYFDLLSDSDAGELTGLLASLGRLGDHPDWQRRLAVRPELAGLLAGSLEAEAQGPALILETIPNDQSNPEILSLYGLLASPQDSIGLAQVLRRDGELIERLCRRGGVGCRRLVRPTPRRD